MVQQGLFNKNTSNFNPSSGIRIAVYPPGVVQGVYTMFDIASLYAFAILACLLVFGIS